MSGFSRAMAGGLAWLALATAPAGLAGERVALQNDQVGLDRCAA